LNLEETTRSLLAQIPSAESAELLRREKRLEKFGAVAWRGFGAIFLTAISALVYAIITGMILSGKNPLAGVLLSAFIIFSAMMLAYVYFHKELNEEKKQLRRGLRNELADSRTTRDLLVDKPFQNAPGATENSTEFLSIDSQTRKLK
jgi:hypothetical protein